MKKTILILISVFLFCCNSKEKNKDTNSTLIENTKKNNFKKMNQEDFLEIKESFFKATAIELHIATNEVTILGVLESETNYIWFASQDTRYKAVNRYKFIADKNFKKVTKSVLKGGPFAMENEINKLIK